jgi:predicted metal-dependent phosphoesterase TrpH
MNYSGILHVHTQYSHDCDVPMLQVLRAARRARLDFLGITDHYNRGAATDPTCWPRSGRW